MIIIWSRQWLCLNWRKWHHISVHGKWYQFLIANIICILTGVNFICCYFFSNCRRRNSIHSVYIIRLLLPEKDNILHNNVVCPAFREWNICSSSWICTRTAVSVYIHVQLKLFTCLMYYGFLNSVACTPLGATMISSMSDSSVTLVGSLFHSWMVRGYRRTCRLSAVLLVGRDYWGVVFDWSRLLLFHVVSYAAWSNECCVFCGLTAHKYRLTNLAPLLWTFSSLSISSVKWGSQADDAYSSFGLTSAVYAASLTG